jgi:lysozyme family protein
MSIDRFEICLKHTLEWEGGWSNHPKDPGGPTMRGVIQRVYDAYRARKGLPKQTVRNIEEHELREIYRTSYWDAVKGDELPPGLDLAVFDFGVNSGPARAARYLQEALRIQADGSIGPATLAACDGCDHAETVKALMAKRRKFIRQIRTYRTFGKGWNRRLDGIGAAALAAVGAPVKKAPPVPIPDPDAQSDSQGRAIDVIKPAPAVVTAGASTVATGSLWLASMPAPPDLSALSNWSSWGSTVQSLYTWAHGSPIIVLVVLAVLSLMWVIPWFAARVRFTLGSAA